MWLRKKTPTDEAASEGCPDLPTEIWVHIFHYSAQHNQSLQFLTNCRLVCTTWAGIISAETALPVFDILKRMEEIQLCQDGRFRIEQVQHHHAIRVGNRSRCFLAKHKAIKAISSSGNSSFYPF